MLLVLDQKSGVLGTNLVPAKWVPRAKLEFAIEKERNLDFG